MSAHRDHYPVAAMCRVLGVSPSGYYAWRKRGSCRRAQRDRELLEMIRRVHAESRGTYGAPRVHAELRVQGVRVGRKRVAWLMRRDGLAGVSRRRKKRTTMGDPGAEPASDLVGRDFSASRPDELWVADITYIPTGEGYLYLAVVVDAFSRRVVGWAMGGPYRDGASTWGARNGDPGTASPRGGPSLRP